MRPLRVVVIGGIGSGKSEVGRMLAERGFAVLDADHLGHEVLAAGHPVAAQVAERWPEAVVDGKVDRGLLGRIVFDDPSALAELEALTHPAIRRLIERWATGAGARPAAVQIPLLKELADPSWVRVAVDAPGESRRRRLRQRGMSDRDIDARMVAQPSREDWLSRADLVLDNSGTKRSLAAEIDRVLGSLTAGPTTTSHQPPATSH
ncbi:MAG: dephospho-CoA kinase [bacterium]|nr:dephospho-CoA kinase [bacterium]MDE0287741.1 dephospho-CoA kinase [bacterium]MDE0436889.1 dephospho-CoA kinase [bacterium]